MNVKFLKGSKLFKQDYFKLLDKDSVGLLNFWEIFMMIYLIKDDILMTKLSS